LELKSDVNQKEIEGRLEPPNSETGGICVLI